MWQVKLRQGLPERGLYRDIFAQCCLNNFQAMHWQRIDVGNITGVAAGLNSVFAGANYGGANPFNRLAQHFLRQLFQVLTHVTTEYRTNIAVSPGITTIDVLRNTSREDQMLDLLEALIIRERRSDHESFGHRRSRSLLDDF